MVEVEVTFDYDAEQEDELTIHVGDVIKNVVKSEGGWWEGELNGKTGMFPDNFVKVREKNTEESPKIDSNKTSKNSVRELANKIKENVHVGGSTLAPKKEIAKKKKAKVLFDYNPENEDEIKIEVGDVVEVLQQAEEGWWEGSVNGKKGMFPSNFVEEIDDEEAEKLEKAAADKKKDAPPEAKKKVMGVGLGNIFEGGPIKLRTTGALSKPESKETKTEDAPPVEHRTKTNIHAIPARRRNINSSQSDQVIYNTNPSLFNESPVEETSWLSIVFSSQENSPSKFSKLDFSSSALGEDLQHLSHMKARLSDENLIEYADIDVAEKENTPEWRCYFSRMEGNTNNNFLDAMSKQEASLLTQNELSNSVDSFELYRDTLKRRSHFEEKSHLQQKEKKKKSVVRKVFSLFAKKPKSAYLTTDDEVHVALKEEKDCEGLVVLGKAMPIHQTVVPSLKLLCQVLVNEQQLTSHRCLSTDKCNTVLPSASKVGEPFPLVEDSDSAFDEGILSYMCSDNVVEVSDTLEMKENEDEKVLQKFREEILLEKSRNSSQFPTLQNDDISFETEVTVHCQNNSLEEEKADFITSAPTVASDSYLQNLLHRGHMSPFLQAISDKYDLFKSDSAKKHFWKSSHPNPQKTDVKRDSDVTPKVNFQEPERLSLQEIKDAVRIPSCNPEKLEKIYRKTPMPKKRPSKPELSPSYRVLPPGTVKETICKYEQLLVNEFVSDVIQEALDNIDEENLAQKCQLEEGIRQTQEEESMVLDNTFPGYDYTSALSEQMVNSMDCMYMSAMSDLEANSSLLVSMLSNSDSEDKLLSTELVNDTLRMAEEEMYLEYEKMQEEPPKISTFTSPIPKELLIEIRNHYSPLNKELHDCSTQTHTDEGLDCTATPHNSFADSVKGVGKTVDRATSPIDELNRSFDLGSCSIDLNTPSKGKPRYSSSPIKTDTSSVEQKSISIIPHISSNKTSDGEECSELVKDKSKGKKRKFSLRKLFQKNSPEPVKLLTYKKFEESDVPWAVRDTLNFNENNKARCLDLCEYDQEPTVLRSPQKLSVAISESDLQNNTIGAFFENDLMENHDFNHQNFDEPDGAIDVDNELVVIGHAMTLWPGEQGKVHPVSSSCPSQILTPQIENDFPTNMNKPRNAYCTPSENCSSSEKESEDEQGAFYRHIKDEIEQIRHEIDDIQYLVKQINDEEKFLESQSDMASTDDMSLDSPNFSKGTLLDIQQKVEHQENGTEGEGQENLDYFIKEALKPIDDLLGSFGSADSEGRIEDDDRDHYIQNMSYESVEKYPSFTYVSPRCYVYDEGRDDFEADEEDDGIEVENLEEEEDIERSLERRKERYKYADMDWMKTNNGQNEAVDREFQGDNDGDDDDNFYAGLKDYIPQSYTERREGGFPHGVNTGFITASQYMYEHVAPRSFSPHQQHFLSQHIPERKESEEEKMACHGTPPRHYKDLERYPSFSLVEPKCTNSPPLETIKEQQENGNGERTSSSSSTDEKYRYEDSFEGESSSDGEIAGLREPRVIEDDVMDYFERYSEDFSSEDGLMDSACNNYRVHSQSFERQDELREFCDDSRTTLEEVPAIVVESELSSTDVSQQNVLNIAQIIPEAASNDSIIHSV